MLKRAVESLGYQFFEGARVNPSRAVATRALLMVQSSFGSAPEFVLGYVRAYDCPIPIP